MRRKDYERIVGGGVLWFLLTPTEKTREFIYLLASARDFVRGSCCLCQRQWGRQNRRSEKSDTQLQEPG